MIVGLSYLSYCNLWEKDNKSNEAKLMLKKLYILAEKKQFMFGHHDDTVYGIGWDGDENRSDVKSVCGDYPAMISFDLGRMEILGNRNLDNVSLDKIRKEVIAQYKRGGMVWHYKIFCVNGNTGFRNESRIFYFIHLQNEEDYERKESSSA